MTIMQIRKEVEADEGIQRQAILSLSAFKKLKTVILVDEDVDIFRYERRDLEHPLPRRQRRNRPSWNAQSSPRPIGIASLQSRRHSLSGHEC